MLHCVFVCSRVLFLECVFYIVYFCVCVCFTLCVCVCVCVEMSGTGQGQRSAEEDKENRAEQRREICADVERDERRVVLGPKRRVEERWPLCCTRRGVRLYDPRGWRPVVCSVV